MIAKKVPRRSTSGSEPASAIPKGKKGGKRGKGRKVGVFPSFGSYIYKVLKQIHPNAGISKKAMIVLDNAACDLLDRIAREAGTLARYNKRQTVSAREIQTASRLVLTGELAKHAVIEGTKAVTKYNSSMTIPLSN